MKQKRQRFYKRVKSLDELRTAIMRPLYQGGKAPVEISLSLKGNLCSRKMIDFNRAGWIVENYIDGSTQRGLSDARLAKETNIVKAIELGACFLEL